MSGVAAALQILADPTFWMAVIAITAPLLFAALGASICGRAGVLNLGIEGIFAAGAIAAVLTSNSGGGRWAALLAAACAGTLIGLLSGILTSPLQLSQRVVGLGITLLATGLSQLLFAATFTLHGVAPRVDVFGSIDLSWISRLPYVGALPEIPYVKTFGNALLHAAPPVYVALLLIPAASFVINRTPLGLALRACGENPDAIVAQGRSVHGLRIVASTVGSALAAIGGGTLALTSAAEFSLSFASGRGFAALALALIAGWRVGKIFVAVLAFAMLDTYQLHLQHRLGDPLALTLSPLLPYVATLAVMIATSRSTMRRFPLPAD
jgi:general nucleoside transport system permease protein